MFYIFFSIVWMFILSIITYGFYGNVAGTITVNGAVVSQAEFSAMLWPKLFIGFFWFIGIFILVKGIIKVKKDMDTEKKGDITYGRIKSIYKSGAYVNDAPEYKADIEVYDLSTFETKTISEIIGFNPFKYSENTYVEVKYYNNDINIVRVVEKSEIPLDISEKIVIDNMDTIIVDGVEYVRKDSIDREIFDGNYRKNRF